MLGAVRNGTRRTGKTSPNPEAIKTQKQTEKCCVCRHPNLRLLTFLHCQLPKNSLCKCKVHIGSGVQCPGPGVYDFRIPDYGSPEKIEFVLSFHGVNLADGDYAWFLCNASEVLWHVVGVSWAGVSSAD